MAQRVFVSYRRIDLSNQATALKIVLENVLPDVSVFVDTEAIRPGDPWPERLRTALENSALVVALIGPLWRGGPEGSDRFTDPDDWVLREVATGLERDCLVPVLFDVGRREALADLPPALAGLPRIEPHTVRPGADWSRDVGVLAGRLAELLGTKRAGGEIRYPKPSELKKRFPRVSQVEFEEYKLTVSELGAWTYVSAPVETPDGVIEGTEIVRSFQFTNFRRAFTFMERVARYAEQRPHHPDWTNVWNRVDVRLRTFDADQSVTSFDIEMAYEMTRIANAVARAEELSWPIGAA